MRGPLRLDRPSLVPTREGWVGEPGRSTKLFLNAFTTGAKEGGARCRQARAGQVGSRESRRWRKRERDPTRRLDHAGERPVRRARRIERGSPRHRSSLRPTQLDFGIRATFWVDSRGDGGRVGSASRSFQPLFEPTLRFGLDRGAGAGGESDRRII